MTTAPNWRERKALRALIGEQWEYKAQLYVGEKTIASLVEKQWIELHPESSSRTEKYRITELGKQAYDMPADKNAKPKHRLSMLKPQISELPPLVGTLPRGKGKW